MSQNFHNRQTFSDENTLIIRKRNTVLCLANENILNKVLGGNRFELAPVKKWLGWQFKIYLHKFAAFCLASTMMIAWWKKIQCERERKRDLAIPNTNARNLNTKNMCIYCSWRWEEWWLHGKAIIWRPIYRAPGRWWVQCVCISYLSTPLKADNPTTERWVQKHKYTMTQLHRNTNTHGKEQGK